MHCLDADACTNQYTAICFVTEWLNMTSHINIELCSFMCANIYQNIGSSDADASNVMRTPSLASHRTVSFLENKAVWNIAAEDTLDIDGVIFVRLNKGNSSLSSLVGNIGGYLCLKWSKGLESMQQMRNAVRDVASDDAGESSLFDEAPRTSNKRIHTSRDVLKNQRQHPRIVEIQLKLKDEEDVISVKTIKAIHPNDCVWIEFVDEAIGAAIQFMVEGGFHDRAKRKRQLEEELPGGMQKRRMYNGEVGYRVQYKKDELIKFKCFTNLHDALTFHADPEYALEAEAEADAVAAHPQEYPEADAAEQDHQGDSVDES